MINRVSQQRITVLDSVGIYESKTVVVILQLAEPESKIWEYVCFLICSILYIKMKANSLNEPEILEWEVILQMTISLQDRDIVMSAKLNDEARGIVHRQ